MDKTVEAERERVELSELRSRRNRIRLDREPQKKKGIKKKRKNRGWNGKSRRDCIWRSGEANCGIKKREESALRWEVKEMMAGDGDGYDGETDGVVAGKRRAETGGRRSGQQGRMGLEREVRNGP